MVQHVRVQAVVQRLQAGTRAQRNTAGPTSRSGALLTHSALTAWRVRCWQPSPRSSAALLATKLELPAVRHASVPMQHALPL